MPVNQINIASWQPKSIVQCNETQFNSSFILWTGDERIHHRLYLFNQLLYLYPYPYPAVLGMERKCTEWCLNRTWSGFTRICSFKAEIDMKKKYLQYSLRFELQIKVLITRVTPTFHRTHMCWFLATGTSTRADSTPSHTWEKHQKKKTKENDEINTI